MARITTTVAAEILAMSVETVRKLAIAGVLDWTTNSGQTGYGKRRYFDRGQVEAFAKGGPKAAEAYRSQQDRPLKAKKGRRRGVSA